MIERLYISENKVDPYFHSTYAYGESIDEYLNAYVLVFYEKINSNVFCPIVLICLSMIPDILFFRDLTYEIFLHFDFAGFSSQTLSAAKYLDLYGLMKSISEIPCPTPGSSAQISLPTSKMLKLRAPGLNQFELNTDNILALVKYASAEIITHLWLDISTCERRIIIIGQKALLYSVISALQTLIFPLHFNEKLITCFPKAWNKPILDENSLIFHDGLSIIGISSEDISYYTLINHEDCKHVSIFDLDLNKWRLGGDYIEELPLSMNLSTLRKDINTILHPEVYNITSFDYEEPAISKEEMAFRIQCLFYKATQRNMSLLLEISKTIQDSNINTNFESEWEAASSRIPQDVKLIRSKEKFFWKSFFYCKNAELFVGGYFNISSNIRFRNIDPNYNPIDKALVTYTIPKYSNLIAEGSLEDANLICASTYEFCQFANKLTECQKYAGLFEFKQKCKRNLFSNACEILPALKLTQMARLEAENKLLEYQQTEYFDAIQITIADTTSSSYLLMLAFLLQELASDAKEFIPIIVQLYINSQALGKDDSFNINYNYLFLFFTEIWTKPISLSLLQEIPNEFSNTLQLAAEFLGKKFSNQGLWVKKFIHDHHYEFAAQTPDKLIHNGYPNIYDFSLEVINQTNSIYTEYKDSCKFLDSSIANFSIKIQKFSNFNLDCFCDGLTESQILLGLINITNSLILYSFIVSRKTEIESAGELLEFLSTSYNLIGGYSISLISMISLVKAFKNKIKDLPSMSSIRVLKSSHFINVCISIPFGYSYGPNRIETISSLDSIYEYKINYFKASLESIRKNGNKNIYYKVFKPYRTCLSDLNVLSSQAM